MYRFSDIVENQKTVRDIAINIKKKGMKSIYTVSGRIDEETFKTMARRSTELGINYSDYVRLGVKLLNALFEKTVYSTFKPDALYLVLLGIDVKLAEAIDLEKLI